MMYVAHITPPKDFCQKISLLYDSIRPYVLKKPSLGTHCTLMTLFANEKDESSIIDELRRIPFREFSLRVKTAEIFSSNALVLRLELTPQIKTLHYHIIESLKQFIIKCETLALTKNLSVTFSDNMIKVQKIYGLPYVGPFYKPHITLAYLKPGIKEVPKLNLKNLFFTVKSFKLSKKVPPWKEITNFKCCK